MHGLAWVPLWRRYIDDGFAVVQRSQLDRLLRAFDTFHPKLTFKVKWSFHDAVFLDLQIFRHNRSLATRLYRKPLNAYLYLNPSSSHPTACYRFIRGEIIRCLRCCSLRLDFVREVAFLRRKLLLRGYLPTDFDKQLANIDFLDRDALITSLDRRLRVRRDSFQRDAVPFVLNFLPGLDHLGIQKVLDENACFLEGCDLKARVLYRLSATFSVYYTL